LPHPPSRSARRSRHARTWTGWRHADPAQKLAYTTALALGAVLVITGFALYKPVQLSWLVATLGGLRLTRIWHFAAMAGLLAFIPGHLLMVAIHGWSNFASMWTGSRSDFASRRSIADR
jgi:thiosulfate reductase cytochrome b subunit